MSKVPADPRILEAALRAIHAGFPGATLTVTEMGEIQADAVKVASYHQFVRPAEEATRQEELRQHGETQRFRISEGKVYLVLAALLGLIGFRLYRDNAVDAWLVVLVPVV